MSSTALTIPYPLQYQPAECLHWLDRGYDEVLYHVHPQGVIRAIAIGGKPYILDLQAGTEAWELHISPTPDPTEQEQITAYVTDWLGLQDKLQPFYEHLATHPPLKPLLDFRGLPLVGIPDLFEALCWSILGQQINLRFAYQLKRRLVEHYGTAIQYRDRTCWLFPTPEQILSADPEALRDMKISRSKINYLQIIAAAMHKGTLSKAGLLALPAFAERQKALIAHKGIGVWTANYVLMKCLRDPGAIPWGDAGLHNALINLGIMKDKNDSGAAKALFAGFTGWESLLVVYLWRSLTAKK